MLSSVLRSERAVEVNIAIMRAFVRLRQLLSSHADLARKLDELEHKYDKQFAIVFEAIRVPRGVGLRPALQIPAQRQAKKPPPCFSRTPRARYKAAIK